MRHGLMMRALAAAALCLAVGTAAQAGGKDNCNTCATPVVVQGVGNPAPCGEGGPKVKKHAGLLGGTTAACDAHFILGPSKGFFAPCNPGCSDLPISVFHSGFRKDCPLPVYGPGIGKPACSCTGVYTNLMR